HPFHDAGAEVVDDNVAAFDQPADDGPSRFRAEVQRDAALVAIEAAEYRVERAGRVVNRPARQIAGVDALDLNHIGAPVTEHLGTAGAKHDLREVDHLNPIERQIRHGYSASRTRASARDGSPGSAPCARNLRCSAATSTARTGTPASSAIAAAVPAASPIAMQGGISRDIFWAGGVAE